MWSRRSVDVVNRVRLLRVSEEPIISISLPQLFLKVMDSVYMLLLTNMEIPLFSPGM